MQTDEPSGRVRFRAELAAIDAEMVKPVDLDLVISRALEMGAKEPDISAWLDKPIASIGATPNQLVDQGRGELVLQHLQAMEAGTVA